MIDEENHTHSSLLHLPVAQKGLFVTECVWVIVLLRFNWPVLLPCQQGCGRSPLTHFACSVVMATALLSERYSLTDAHFGTLRLSSPVSLRRHEAATRLRYCLHLGRRLMFSFSEFRKKIGASIGETKMAAMPSRKVPFYTDWIHLIKHRLSPFTFQMKSKEESSTLVIRRLWGRWTGTEKRSVMPWYKCVMSMCECISVRVASCTLFVSCIWVISYMCKHLHVYDCAVVFPSVCILNFSHVLILVIFPYLGFKCRKDPVTW